MPPADLNKTILIAVLQIIEAWVDEDRAVASLANGLTTHAERNQAVSGARAKKEAATDLLSELLPSIAHTNLFAGLGAVSPSPNAPVGETTRRWGGPGQRMGIARALLKSAADAQRRAVKHAEATRRAAAEEAERLAAEEARRLVEEEAEGRRLAERAAVLHRYRASAEEIFIADFLGADKWFATWDTAGHVTRNDFTYWKAEFVQAWAREALKDYSLDLEQARAVASTFQDLRLVARAGSGKTRTIVTRAIFLQLHCRVDAGAIVLVAFNRNAVAEISKRIRDGLPQGAAMPHVVTFHALAYALLRPDEDLVFDDEESESLAQSRKVQAVVDDFLLERSHEVRRAMLGHFKDSWKAIQRRGLNLDRNEYFESRVEVTRVTLAGEYVKSYGERLIANTLFEHDVEYKYERNFTRGGFNYRPDFTVFLARKSRVVIEYFGVTGDPAYLANAEQKRAFWATQPDLDFIEYSPSHIASVDEETFQNRLLEHLELAGVPHRRLTEDEIWDRIRRRAIDTFSKALRGFVNRARQLNLTADDLRNRLSTLDAEESVADFVELAADVYEQYLARASSEGYEDFSGVMWRAAGQVRAGHTTWVRAGGKERGDLRNLRFLHVDEFQDFSQMFMEFVEAIRSQSPDASLCCVGDDWQAINGFAGADLRFFEMFEDEFPGSTTQELATNYRSPRRVVSAGNAVMSGLGTPARASKEAAGSIRIARLDSFKPTPGERERFPGDIGTPALLRLIKDALDKSAADVAVLFRRNTVPWFTNSNQGVFGRKLEAYLSHLREHFASEDAKRIDVTTSHKYKGREADFVIVADADKKSYPLIHPTAELFEVFGDTLDRSIDAERRLFYVATTRAETSLCYLVTTEQASPFMSSIVPTADTVTWDDLPTAVSGPKDMVEIRVYDAFEVRESLKNPFGFKFDEATKAWYTFRPAENFEFPDVLERLSFIEARLIEVRNASNEVIHRAGARLKRSW